MRIAVEDFLQAEVTAEVNRLLAAKKKFKDETGKDWTADMIGGSTAPKADAAVAKENQNGAPKAQKPAKKETPSKAQPAAKADDVDAKGKKKETK